MISIKEHGAFAPNRIFGKKDPKMNKINLQAKVFCYAFFYSLLLLLLFILFCECSDSLDIAIYRRVLHKYD